MPALGPRLEAALSFLPGAEAVADVGADHGFFAIEAVARKRAKRALAVDNKPAPLAAAIENVRRAGLAEMIRCVRDDGLPAGHGCDAVAILGLGGLTIEAILAAADLQGVDRLILGPQSDAAAVRGWLEDHGFAIDREAFVTERGKHYQILSAVRGTMRLSDVERAFGPLILHERNAAFRRFVRSRLAELESGRAATADPARRADLDRRIDALKELIR